MTGNYSNACRKYEEAYSIWSYFKSTDPFCGDLNRIKDSKLEEVNWTGRNEFERKAIH